VARPAPVRAGTTWALAALCAAVLALALAPPAAGAGVLQADTEAAIAELGLSVSAGYDGQGAPGAWVPVEVALQPARLAAGTLEVSVRTDGGRNAQERAVEVTAGSRKVFRFLVPAGTVGVRFSEEGRDPVGVRAPVRQVGTWLAGVLGPLPGGLPVLRHAQTGASGTWVAVDPAWVDLSPWALESLGALVLDRDGLAALSEQGRANLAVAVATGLDLVVVTDAGGPVDLEAAGLPWQPVAGVVPAADGAVALEAAPGTWTLDAEALDAGGAGVVVAGTPAGLGRVVGVGAAPGVGALGRSEALWSLVAGPAASAVADSGWRVDRNPWQVGRLLQPEGGSAAPSLPWLAAFMAVYVLVVGPVNGLLLARLRRRELAWVTVPIVTVIFTGAAFVGAVREQPEAGLAGRLAYWVDGVGAEAVIVGARSATPGDHRIELEGSGWIARSLVETEVGATLTVADGVTVDVELAALQLGSVSARRPLSAAPPLAVEVLPVDGGLQVTVTNVSSRPVADVRLRSASLAKRVGDLAPGSSETVEVDTERLPVMPAHGDPFDAMGQPTLPATMEAVLRGDVADGAPGMVWAIGSTDEPVAGVRIDGRAPYDAGSLVAVGARVPAGGDTVSPFAVERELIAFGQDLHRYAPMMVEGAGEAFLRFRLPPGAEPGRLRSELDRGGQGDPRHELTVWDAAERRWVGVAEAFGDAGEDGDAAALVGPLGEVWVRATGEFFPFEFSGRSVSGGSA
jgi:hypothetical protein